MRFKKKRKFFTIDSCCSLQSGPIVYAWDSLMLAKDLMKQRDETGRLTFQNKQVENLEPDTAYVAKIKV